MPRRCRPRVQPPTSADSRCQNLLHHQRTSGAPSTHQRGNGPSPGSIKLPSHRAAMGRHTAGRRVASVVRPAAGGRGYAVLGRLQRCRGPRGGQLCHCAPEGLTPVDNPRPKAPVAATPRGGNFRHLARDRVVFGQVQQGGRLDGLPAQLVVQAVTQIAIPAQAWA